MFQFSSQFWVDLSVIILILMTEFFHFEFLLQDLACSLWQVYTVFVCFTGLLLGPTIIAQPGLC